MKVRNIALYSAISFGVGYLTATYGRQIFLYMRNNRKRESLQDIAEDIKRAMQTNTDTMCNIVDNITHTLESIKIDEGVKEKKCKTFNGVLYATIPVKKCKEDEKGKS